MAFCQYCSTVPSRIFSSRRDQQGYHDHHETRKDLDKSAAAGCKLCALLSRSLDLYTGKWASTWQGEVKDRYRLCSTKFGAQELLFGYSKVGYFRGGCLPEEWRDEQPPGPNASEADMLDFETYMLQRWAGICFEKHEGCGHSTDYLPTRVLDVQDQDIKLITTADHGIKDCRYLALSHCWGSTMPGEARTNSTNLASHHKHIDYDALPLTFRDFIDIARRMRVHHVWIDSLCIIQDSKEDWEQESARMADVYSKSYLTIAASGSADGTGGCRVDPNSRWFGPVDIECLVDDASSRNTKYRIWTKNPDPITQVLQDDPLSKRGWCLQERELSHRVVHYSKDTIRWECRELSTTLEFPCNDYLPFDSGRLFEGGSEFRAPQFGPPHNDGKPLDTITRGRLAWFELVQKYTARKLTNQSDILPALSGLARSIAAKTDDQYIAGLWKSYLPQCLLWSRARSSGDNTVLRSLAYLAPSWSWASMRGPVQFAMRSYYDFQSDPDPAFVPELIDVQLEISSQDPFGQLSAGHIKLRGKMKIAMSMQAYDTSGDQPRHRTMLSSTVSGRGIEQVGYLDYDDKLKSGSVTIGHMELVFLLCCMAGKKSESGTFTTYALALQPNEVNMAFNNPSMVNDLVAGGFPKMKRIALVGGIKSEVWDDAAVFELTLV